MPQPSIPSSFSNGNTNSGGNFPKTMQAGKPKKVPRCKPKLTPNLFLSDDGLGFVLPHFTHAFKYRGHGYEVSDLGKLFGLYNEWHSHLLPYYSFDQFIYKVEQVATTRRVKRFKGASCLWRGSYKVV